MSLILASRTQNGLTVSQGVVCEDVIGVSLRANVNDFDPPGADLASTWEITPSNSFNISGVAGGIPGRRLTLINVSSGNNVNILDNSVLSAAANRFDLTVFGPTYPLIPRAIIQFQYVRALSRWVVMMETF